MRFARKSLALDHADSALVEVEQALLFVALVLVHLADLDQQPHIFGSKPVPLASA